MSTIAQLVAHIQAVPAPVVFLDSCAILDVARAPRDHPDSVKAASDLIQLSKQTPRAVYLLVSDIVQKEWDDNIASVNSSANHEIEKARFAYETVLRIASAAGVIPHPSPLQRLTTLASSLKDRSEELLR